MFFVLEMVSEGALLIEVYKTTIKALKKHEGPKIANLGCFSRIEQGLLELLVVLESPCQRWQLKEM